MISYQEALDIIKKHAYQPESILVNIDHAIGRILDEEIIADRDFPPFDRVTMDGIAISYQAFASGQRTFDIESTIGAGMPKSELNDAQKCVQIMTGAIMPDGADTVIRYEDITIDGDIATINEEHIREKQNVHFKAQDRNQCDVVLPKGFVLHAPELIVAASVGKSKLKVKALPKAAIITTGDELVQIDETPLTHQIRRSSNYGVQGLLNSWNIEVDQFHLKDDKNLMMNELSSIIETYQLVVLTGGVSRGKFDFLPAVMDELGVQKRFHKVKQRPGKPFWFGNVNNTTVFALPGNPVSSFVCANVYIRHWLNHSLGLSNNLLQVQLAEDVNFVPPLTYFLECSLKSNELGILEAQPFKGHGSGDFANMSRADGFIILPDDKSEFKAGEVYPYISYRNTAL